MLLTFICFCGVSIGNTQHPVSWVNDGMSFLALGLISLFYLLYVLYHTHSSECVRSMRCIIRCMVEGRSHTPTVRDIPLFEADSINVWNILQCNVYAASAFIAHILRNSHRATYGKATFFTLFWRSTIDRANRWRSKGQLLSILSRTKR